jgi:hypothetical protein
VSTQNNLIIVIGNVKPHGVVYKNKNKNKRYGMNLLVVNSLQLNCLVTTYFASKFYSKIYPINFVLHSHLEKYRFVVLHFHIEKLGHCGMS